MAIKTEWVTTQTADGPMRVYIARPEGAGSRPGVIVIQEIFGVNDNIQGITRRLAEEGFVAAAPEIFHRFERKLVPYSEMQEAMALRQRLSDDQVMMDVNATFDLLNAQPDVRGGQIGIVGFCYGGRVAYLAGTRNPNLKAIVPFYGGRIVADDPSAPIHASANIQAPMLLFFGEQDQSIPMAQVEQIRQTLTQLNKQFELVTYPQAGHGFMCDDRPASYNEEAARDAWPRMVAFLKEKLGA